MTIKTYSRARAAVAAARAFCEKNSILAADFEARDGLGIPGFTCVIVAEGKDASTITAGGWMYRQAPTPELPEGLLNEKAEAMAEEMTKEELNEAIEAAMPTEPKAKAPGYIAEKSTRVGPTKRVWHIADAMKGQPRKAVIEACRAEGIAYGTARTQYQEWKKANGL